jgi:Putative adhesin
VAADYAAAPHTEDARVHRGLRRRLSRWGLLVAACATMLLAALAVLAVLWAVSSDRSSTTYSVGATILEVEMEVTRGSVEIIGGGREEVQVLRTDRSVYGHEPTEQRAVVDGVLRIESSCASLVVGSCAADYRVTVPESVAVTIAAEHGDVRLTAYRGSANVSTGDGTISADSYCGYVLQATTRSGSIDVTALCSPDQLELRTDTGDLTATVPPGRYGIEADTNGGMVSVVGLERDDEAPWTIRALSNSGDIVVKAAS